jgi:hypothetical protein
MDTSHGSSSSPSSSSSSLFALSNVPDTILQLIFECEEYKFDLYYGIVSTPYHLVCQRWNRIRGTEHSILNITASNEKLSQGAKMNKLEKFMKRMSSIHGHRHLQIKCDSCGYMELILISIFHLGNTLTTIEITAHFTRFTHEQHIVWAGMIDLMCPFVCNIGYYSMDEYPYGKFGERIKGITWSYPLPLYRLAHKRNGTINGNKLIVCTRCNEPNLLFICGAEEKCKSNVGQWCQSCVKLFKCITHETKLHLECCIDSTDDSCQLCQDVGNRYISNNRPILCHKDGCGSCATCNKIACEEQHGVKCYVCDKYYCLNHINKRSNMGGCRHNTCHGCCRTDTQTHITFCDICYRVYKRYQKE